MSLEGTGTGGPAGAQLASGQLPVPAAGPMAPGDGVRPVIFESCHRGFSEPWECEASSSVEMVAPHLPGPCWASSSAVAPPEPRASL